MKRFYKTVRAEPAEGGGWRILLDGREVKTPARRTLVAPARALADAVVAEWEGQGEEVKPATMPLTRALNSALDRVEPERDAVLADLAGYAGSDLLCYRAESPEELVARQRAAWDPLLDWAREVHGLRLTLTEGVMPVAQPDGTGTRARALLEPLDAARIAALHAFVTITGSFVLGLAVIHRRIGWEQAWTLSTLDEDWQAGLWGRDAEAEARAARRRAEMETAGRLLDLLDAG
ncbi:MAG: ATPase [Alphaproteobacteria bacterium]|nr:ATPase [Alphaproteobacteria bacterium]MDX5368124.1 ATPase [Alphaproteobacteria bacterium]MDX5462959.1 ATPase [Alphaproteobacteria bacterium]